MSDSKVRGVVHLIEDAKSYGQKGFRKRLVVLEQDNGRFTNYIPLEFTNDGCDKADDLNLGDEVDIVYRLSGRKWQKDPDSEVKYFLSAEALSFKLVKGKSPSAESSSDPNDELAEAGQDADSEDVPF